jgi:purine-binding chemotaxis protein CheW
MSVLAPHNPSAAAPLEILAFTLGKEEYGIDIQRVQELRGYDTVTAIANAPEFIKGVVNLRGSIVPILDLRLKFNMDASDYDQFTVVIIVNVGGRLIGMVVDSVSDVIALSREQIKPAPQMAGLLDSEHLIGLGTVGERMLIPVDLVRLMASASMSVIPAVAAPAAD